MPFKFSFIKTGKALTCKQFALAEGGTLSKTSAAQIFKGTVHIEEYETLREFIGIRQDIDRKTAFVYGIPANEKKTQSLRSKNSEGLGVSRTKDEFKWPEGAGVLFIDVDEAGHTVETLDAIIMQAYPGWAAAQRCWLPSSSAFIRTKDGSELIGPGGWRAYLIADNAARIPDITDYLHYRLWELGHGRITVSKSGARLDRSLIDRCVASVERIDFVAEPVLGDGLERFAPEPVFIGPEGAHLATSFIGMVQPYKEWKRENPAFLAAWKAEETVARAASDKEAVRRGVDKAALWRAHQRGELPRSWPITLATGETVTVGFLLDEGRPDYDRERCCDPIEPEYDGGRDVGMIFLDDGRAGIWSYARGGRYFTFQEKLGTIDHDEADYPATIDHAIAMLREDDRVFQDRSANLMLIPAASGATQRMNPDRLKTHLSRLANWTYEAKNGRKPGSCRLDIAKAVLAETGDWRLPELSGTITAPTMRLDGTILCSPGYDPTTKLFLIGHGFPIFKPEATLDASLKKALAKVMEPARLFPFASELDRAVYLAAILTGVMRRVLKTAPGFVISAPQPSAGKTKLCQIVNEVASGKQTIITVKNSKDEFQKAIDAALLEGAPSILLDNVTSSSNTKISDSLDAILTAVTYKFRVLGVSAMVEVSAQTLIMISSNNYQPTSDLYRRLLLCRLDAKTSAPEKRSFDFIPEVVARQERQNIVAAALFILKSFHEAGQPHTLDGTTASFEGWDTWIRQCVGWLGMPDIVMSQEALRANDEKAASQIRVLAAINAAFGEEEFTAAELSDRLMLVIHEESLPGDIQKLGLWLSNRKDAINGGFVLRHCGAESGSRRALWKVERTGE